MKEYTVTVYEKTDKGFNPGTYWKNKDGQFHREEGPAIEYADGEVQYRLNGSFLSEAAWKYEMARRNAPAKELTVAEISKLLGYEVKVVKG